MPLINFMEHAKSVWAAEPKNYTGAAMAAKYVSLKTVGKLGIFILTGAWAGGTAAVTLSQATAVAGTSAKALAIANHWHDETTSGTMVKQTTASNTFNLTTANKLYYLEVDPSTLDVAGGFDCVTLAIASPGTNADFYGVLYVATNLRYAQATPPSILID